MKHKFFVLVLFLMTNVAAIVAQSMSFTLFRHEWLNDGEEQTDIGIYTATLTRKMITTDEKIGPEPSFWFDIVDENGKRLVLEWFCKSFRAALTRCDDMVISLKTGELTEGWMLLNKYKIGSGTKIVSFSFTRDNCVVVDIIDTDNKSYHHFFEGKCNPERNLSVKFVSFMHSGVEEGFVKAVSCDDNNYFRLIEKE